MTVLSGVAKRPSGSDGHWPPVGTKVPWKLTQPMQDLVDHGKAAGLQNLGTIGNISHLQRHGDHTPWSAGKLRGQIYAKDTEVPSGFKAWLMSKMRQPDYDTTWIDFVNIENGQYDFAGNYLGPSGDFHLHVSVSRGFESTHVTLFQDWQRRNSRAATAPNGSATFLAAYDRRTHSAPFPLYGKAVASPAPGKPKFEGAFGDGGVRGLTLDARTVPAATLLDWFGVADANGGKSIQVGQRNDGVRFAEAIINTTMDRRDSAFSPSLATMVAMLQKTWGLKVHGRVDHATLVAFGMLP